jgi:hypothetical protein
LQECGTCCGCRTELHQQPAIFVTVSYCQILHKVEQSVTLLPVTLLPVTLLPVSHPPAVFSACDVTCHLNPVYDVTRRETLASLSDSWMAELDRYQPHPDVVRMVVANKVDKVRA